MSWRAGELDPGTDLIWLEVKAVGTLANIPCKEPRIYHLRAPLLGLFVQMGNNNNGRMEDCVGSVRGDNGVVECYNARPVCQISLLHCRGGWLVYILCLFPGGCGVEAWGEETLDWE